MFNEVGVRVLGIIENMSGYQCPHCGEASDPFGHGGAEAEATAMGVPFLGRVPLDIALRTASDAGQPGTGKQAEVFAAIEGTKQNVFVTGRAGTGKSTLAALMASVPPISRPLPIASTVARGVPRTWATPSPEMAGATVVLARCSAQALRICWPCKSKRASRSTTTPTSCAA